MNPAPLSVSPSRKGAPLPRFLRWFSSQCVLRQIDTADAPRLWKALQQPAYERCWTATPPGNEADVAEFIRGAQADWARGTRYVLAVHRKQTQAFVGWVEARAHEALTHRGAWSLDWFVDPGFLNSSLTLEALVGSCDLLMNAVDARVVSVDCPAGHALFETLLAAAGFTRAMPAGGAAAAAGSAQALFVLTQRDWRQARASATGPLTLGGYTEPKLELSLL